MTPSPTDSVMNALALPDDAFFSLDGATTAKLQKDVAALVQPPPLSRPKGASRVALPELRAAGAPTRIDWAQRKTFPLLLAEVRSNQREWEVHSGQNRLLMVSNLTNGHVEVLAPIERARRMAVPAPSRSGQPPDALNATLSSIVVRELDLLKWFPHDRMMGRLAVTALDHELVSNTVVVDAPSPVAAPPVAVPWDPARRVEARAVPPAAGVAGVALTVPSKVSPIAPTLAHGTLRLKRAHLTTAKQPADAKQPLLVAASLLFLQLDKAAPVLLHVTIPATAIAATDEIEAGFELDLRHALDPGPAVSGRPASGDWLLYLVAGDTVTGPHPIHIDRP